MAHHRMKVGDLRPVFYATVKRAGAVDLTGATAVLRMGLEGSADTVDHALTVVSAEDGTVQYEWQDGDTDVAGTYSASIIVTWTDSDPETFPSKGFLEIVIEEGLAAP